MLKQLHCLMLLAAMLCVPWLAQAQIDASDYTFETGVNTSKWIATSSAATTISSLYDEDDASSACINIGFPFFFAGDTVTQFSCSSNGRVRLGSSPVSTAYATPFSGTISDCPLLAAFTGDMTMSDCSSTYVKYELTGTAPERVLVIEFNLDADWNCNVARFQVQLHENNNRICFAYGAADYTYDLNSFQVGIAHTSTDYLLVNPSTHTTGASVNATFSDWVGAGRYYQFTPVISDCPRPYDLTISNITSTAFDLAWTDSSTSTAWVVTLVGADTAFSDMAYTNSYSFTDLTSAVDYTVSVAGICANGDTSLAATIHQLTPCDLFAVPFTENFSTFSTVTADPLPNCWYKNTNYTSNYPYASTSYNHSGSVNRAMYMYSSSTSWSYMVLPQFRPSIDSLQVSFWMYRSNSSYSHDLYVGVISDPTDVTSFEAIDTVSCSAVSTWEEKVINFANYTGTASYICIMSPNGVYSYPYLDDLTVDYAPACPRVEDVYASNITSSSFDVSWTEMGNASSWTVEYGPSGFTLGSEDGTTLYASDTTITILGLDPNTPYDVYVTVDCGSEIGGTNSIVVRTACVALDSLPYTYGFEDASTGTSSNAALFVPCWNRLNNGTSYAGYPYVSNSTSYNHTTGGSKGLYWYNSITTGTYGDYQCVVLPAIDTDMYPINTLQLKFWAKASSTSYSPNFEVGVMTDPYDINTFTQVGTVNVGPNTSWSEFVTYFGSFTGNGQYIAVKATRPASSWYAYVDDFTIDIMPDCVPVSEIALSAIDSNMLAVTWQENGNATSWTIEYGPAGFTPGTGTTEFTSDSVLTVYDLTSNTSYDFYITPDCEGIVESAMATFRTANTYISLPFECDFEDTVQNHLWTLENGSNTNAWYIGSATSNGGDNAMYISNDGGTSCSYTISSSTMDYAYVDVMVPAPGRYTYSFDWKSYGESSLDYIRAALVPVSQTFTAGTAVPSGLSSTSLPAGWISLDGNNKLNLQTNWQNRTDDIDIASAGVYHLVFTFRCDGSVGTNPPAAIDNVMFARVNCTKPLNVTCDAIDQTSASFHWDEAGTATEWQYQIGTEAITSVTDTFATVTGLMPNTQYMFRVRTICGDGDTSFWSVLDVRTACDVVYLPYTMDFEGETTGTSTTGSPFVSCWTRLNNGTSYGGYPYVSSSTTYNHTTGGTRGLYWYNTTTTGTYGDYQCIVLPPFDSTIAPNNVQLRFWAKASSTSYSPVFKVGMLTNPNDITTFVGIDTVTISGNTDWHEFEIPFNTYAGTGRYVAIKADRPTSSWYSYVDDITLEALGACIRPDSLYAANATSTTVDLGWHERGEATEWIVEYGPLGFTPGTGTQVYTTSNPVTLTGLPTSYNGQFYVKALCNAGDTGEYTNTACRFNTAQVAATIPYTYNFEDPAEWNNWQVSTNNGVNWYRGTAEAHNGSYSMYVSANNGTTNGTTSAITNVAAFRDIDFGTIDSSFTITYSAKMGGSTAGRYDGLMVFLVDPSLSTEPSSVAITSPWGHVNDLYRIAFNYLDTNWTTYTASFDTIHGIKRVAFFWFNQANMDSFVGEPAAVDDISITYSACPRPLNLDTVVVRSTSATLTWSGSSTGTYRVAYREVGGANQFVMTNTNSITLTGLTPMTSYYAFVQRINGTDSSLFSDGVAFTTDMCDGAVTIALGDSTSTTSTSYNVPINNFYRYTLGEVIIDSTELGSARDLNAIRLYYDYATASSSKVDVDIYIKPTTKSTFASTADVEALDSTAVLVYSGDLNCEQGWNIFGFNTPYSYDGHGNLMVIFDDNSNAYDGSAYVFRTRSTTGNKSLTYYSDTYDADPYNPSTYSGSKTTYAFRPEMEFISCGEACVAPVITSLSYDYESATLTWTGSSDSYDVNIKESAAANWPADINLSGSTYTFTGLNAATYYTIRVRQYCDESETSDWTEMTFVTDSLPCFAPTNLVASNITNAEATIDWTTNGTESNWDIHVWFAGGFDSIYRVSAHPATVSGFTAGVTYNVAVRALCGSALLEGDWSDAITFTTAICPDVTGLATSNVTTNSIDLSWAADPMAQSWIVEYGFHGFNQGTGTILNVNTNSCHITGLVDETAYDFNVRAVCGNDWTSEGWTSISATTQAATGDSYYVSVFANDASMGTVSGEGQYQAGETATLTATPNAGYEFVSWNDGITDNPRYVVVVSDSTFTATFRSVQSIDGADGQLSCTIYPNPATSTTTISVEGANGMVRIVVVDINGRAVASETIECSTDCAKTIDIDALAQGAYFVRITGENINMVKKLIVR